MENQNDRQVCEYLHNKAMEKYTYVEIQRAKSQPLPKIEEMALLTDAFFMERECAMYSFFCLPDMHIDNKRILFNSAANLAKRINLVEEYHYLKNYLSIRVPN